MKRSSMQVAEVEKDQDRTEDTDQMISVIVRDWTAAQDRHDWSTLGVDWIGLEDEMALDDHDGFE